MKHIVALSGGKDSTAMALRLVEVEPRDYLFVCTPTGDEPEELFAHWRMLSMLLGKQIYPIMHRVGLNGLVDEQQAIPNWRQRWCTRILKIEPFMAFLQRNSPCTSYVGLRADEQGRAGGVYSDVAGVTMRFPLREWGWDVGHVLDYLDKRSVIIPDRTDCRRCFFQTLWEWYVLWRDDRACYLDAEKQERVIGHTWRSPQRDTQPTALKDLRAKFEQGYVPKERRRDSMKALQCRQCTL